MSSYEDQLEIERLAQRIADRDAQACRERDAYAKRKEQAEDLWAKELNKFHSAEFFLGCLATPVCLFIVWLVIHTMMRIGR